MAKKLVAYFSATGTSAARAKQVAQAAGAQLYEIRPTVPYTSADLDWRNRHSRSSEEMNDPHSRAQVDGKVAQMDAYDVVFVGFPIWWGVEPRIVDTFLESYDFSGKTIIPFATSGGSGIEYATAHLRSACPHIQQWRTGKLLNDSDFRKIAAWVEDLGLV